MANEEDPSNRIEDGNDTGDCESTDGHGHDLGLELAERAATREAARNALSKFSAHDDDRSPENNGD